MIWPHARDKLMDFFDFVSNLHPNVKFTIESEDQGRLPFLDVFVYRGDDGPWSTKYIYI